MKFAWTLISNILDKADKIKLAALKKISQSKKDDQEAKKQLAIKKAEIKNKRLKKAFAFFYENTAHVDVIREYESEKKIEMAYFILLPFVKFLPKEKKSEFHQSVDRTNVKTKVQGLVEHFEQLIDVCKHEERLSIFFSKNQFVAIFANYVKLWKDIAFILSIVLNIFILMSYSSVFGSRINEPRLFLSNSIDKSDTRKYFYILGLIMTCCSIFVVMFFLFKNLPLIIKKAWVEFKGENIKKYRTLKYIMHIISNIIKVMLQFLQELEVIYYLAYGTLAVMGTFVNTFFFVFHLSEILIRYPLLKNVIRSVYEPRQ